MTVSSWAYSKIFSDSSRWVPMPSSRLRRLAFLKSVIKVNIIRKAWESLFDIILIEWAVSLSFLLLLLSLILSKYLTSKLVSCLPLINIRYYTLSRMKLWRTKIDPSSNRRLVLCFFFWLRLALSQQVLL